ncbi:MAG TPA: LysR family transcriptional regulator [Candidatus Nanopelagicales bacterium]|jgi:DNA-binding transcriptional LysR family regulator|nr:LysR family transcriptional regulator [Candidatus Nanopelagicales bacterium]
MAGIQDVQIRHLAALRAVAEEGSFGRAGQRLGFSQSAISQQITGLEQAIGQRVFDRPGGPRKAELTPAGRVVLHHAEAILDRIAQAGDELADLRAGTSGRLVVGTFQSVSVKLLPAIIGRILTESPDLDIRVVETDYQEDLANGLHSGELDVAFMEDPIVDDKLVTIEVSRDPFVVVLPADQRESAPEPYPMTDLAGQSLIGSQPCSCQDLIDDRFRRAGITPHYVFRTNDNGAIQAMVKTGMGVAVMPLLAVDAHDPEVAVRHLDPTPEPRRIVLVTRKGRTRTAAAERFIELSVASCRADPTAATVGRRRSA